MHKKPGELVAQSSSVSLHQTHMTAARYRKENFELLEEYEKRVRTWLADNGDKELAEKIPYFRDGVICPERWFTNGNNFRPLIILKEVSLGINNLNELDDYLTLWGNPKYFEFVDNPFDDIRIGTFTQWKRIARLVKCMHELYCGEETIDYHKYDMKFIPSGEIYNGNIEGYKKFLNQRTANTVYNDIVEQMAVIEIKKIGAGQTAVSELSIATKHYTEHIEPFVDLLSQQIELIDPTVIVCLGREGGKCISNLLKKVKSMTGKRLWIDGYHHARSSNVHFFEEPLNVYKEYLKSK